MKIGVKATEPAAPFEIDLQLFADEGEAAIDTGSAETATDANTANADNIDEDEGHDISIGEKQALFDGTAEDQNKTEDLDKKPDAETVPETVKKEQSPEANAAFAEIRRQAEQAQKELATRDVWVEQTFGATHNLHTFEQYQQAIEQTRQQEAMQKQQAIQTRPQQVAQQAYQQLIAAGYDDAVAREIANTKGAAEAAALQNQALTDRLTSIENQSKQQQEQVKTQQQQAQAQQILQSWEAERAKLQEDYGDLVPENLENLDPDIVKGLQGGLSFEKAWLAANIDKVVDLAKGKGAQKAVREVNSKAHLDSEKGGGSGVGKQVHVSDEKLQVWRALGYSDKEARQKEARYQRQQRV